MKNFEKIKIIATDLDGTLVPPSRKFSKYSKETFQKLAERRYKIVIATGRSIATIDEKYMKIPGLFFAITSNGGAAYLPDGETRIYENLINKNAFDYLEKYIKDAQIGIEVFVDGVPYVSGQFYEDRSEQIGLTKEYKKYFISTRRPVSDINDFIIKNRTKIENINLLFFSDIYRLQIFNELYELKEKTKNFSLTSSFSFNLEIGGANVSKAKALSDILKKEGYNLSEVISFGDNINDIEMLKETGISCSVKNSPAAKEFKTDFVTDLPENDGEAKFLRTHLLKE